MRIKFFIKNNKGKFVKYIVFYSIIICFFNLFTSYCYKDDFEPYAENYVDFNEKWIIGVDGRMLNSYVTLPYKIHHKSRNVDIYSKIPSTDFENNLMILRVFQKNIEVSVDGELLYKSKLDKKAWNQYSPGSGIHFVFLPKDYEGKDIHINYQIMPGTSETVISTIKIIDGIVSPGTYFGGSKFLLFIALSMLLVGIIGIITTFVYMAMGIQLYQLGLLSLLISSSSTWLMCNSKIMQFFTPNLVFIHNLEYISFYIVPVALWGFVSTNWDESKKENNMMLFIMGTFFVMSITVKCLGLADMFYFLKMFHMMFLANILYIFYSAIKKVKCRSRSLNIFYLGFVILAIFGLMDFIRYYTVFNTDKMVIFSFAGLLGMAICMILSFVYSTKDRLTEATENRIYKNIAYYDPLTGINSRTKFEEDKKQIWSNLKIKDTMVISIIDVNDLKVVNDTYGHIMGDSLIKIVANEIKTIFSSHSNCYRIGGDEFCIISTGINIRITDLCFKRLDENLENMDFILPISVSYGTSIFDRKIHGEIEDLLEEADRRMYKNKKMFKNKYIL